mgnify:CR=1 FL=1
MSRHVTSLRVNPATGDNRRNVLQRKVVLLAVDNMFLHELVQLVEVVEGDHRITMICDRKKDEMMDSQSKKGAAVLCHNKGMTYVRRENSCPKE